MQIVERFWIAVTTVINIITLSPLSTDQSPLVVQTPASLEQYAIKQGPRFQAPGTSKSSAFKCDYSAMVGWEECSTPSDRSCWLKRTSDGKRYDINTNYENEWPTGVSRHYNLDLKDGIWNADGLSFNQAKLYNDTYPGPWIEACWGDRIVVNVTNNLEYNGTSVHWHGIRQLNTTHMDGVNGVTQCPIAPGDYFVYNFTATQYGSSWYHSHYSVQYADGAAGPITLHGPSSDQWDEAVSPPTIMTDWGHDSAFTAVSLGIGRDSLFKPDILLNGLGDITRYNKSWTNDSVIQPPYSVAFEKAPYGGTAKKYLMRIINTSFQTSFSFSIDNHKLTVVEADFVPVTPYNTTAIFVGIGQRYNVIVEAKPEVDPLNPAPLPEDGNYWIRTTIKDCFADMDPGDAGYDATGILRYDSSSTSNPTSSTWRTGLQIQCEDEAYSNSAPLKPIVPWSVGKPSNGGLDGENFNVSLFHNRDDPVAYPLAFWALGSPEKPPLRIDYSNITFRNLDNDGGWPDLWRIQPEDYKLTDWVYLLIQSPSAGSHPIHLHGHDFAILVDSPTLYDPANPPVLNTNNPPRRDVVLLRNSGFVVIAFKSDNPGPWLVHCHIAFHISAGLGMQILEDLEAARAIWPSDGSSHALKEAARVCGNWDGWMGATSKHFPDTNCDVHDEKCFMNDSGV